MTHTVAAKVFTHRYIRFYLYKYFIYLKFDTISTTVCTFIRLRKFDTVETSNIQNVIKREPLHSELKVCANTFRSRCVPFTISTPQSSPDLFNNTTVKCQRFWYSKAERIAYLIRIDKGECSGKKMSISKTTKKQEDLSRGTKS